MGDSLSHLDDLLMECMFAQLNDVTCMNFLHARTCGKLSEMPRIATRKFPHLRFSDDFI